MLHRYLFCLEIVGIVAQCLSHHYDHLNIATINNNQQQTTINNNQQQSTTINDQQQLVDIWSFDNYTTNGITQYLIELDYTIYEINDDDDDDEVNFTFYKKYNLKS